MATKITLDGYSESNFSSGYISSSTYVGQTFSCSIYTKLDSCKFYIKKQGTPTGNLYVKIYAHTGTYGSTGKPTGAALATSDAIDITTLSNSSFSFVEFSFSGSNKISLTPNYYCVALYYPNNDGSYNNLVWSVDTSSPIHAGNRFIGNGSAWAAEFWDMIFYSYGTTVDYSMSAATRSYTLTGRSANLKSALKIPITKAEFTLTGIDNVFGTGKGIYCAVGAFTLTGINNAYAIGLSFPVSVGTYSLTGNNVNLKLGYTISAVRQTYALTLKDNNFDIGTGMPTSVGTFLLGSGDITFSIGNLWTKNSKATSSWTNETENTAIWVNEEERENIWSNNQGYLLMEDGNYLLQENGDKIVIAKFYTEDDVWNNETENTTPWTKI